MKPRSPLRGRPPLCVSGYTPVSFASNRLLRPCARRLTSLSTSTGIPIARASAVANGAPSVRPFARRIEGWTNTSAARNQRATSSRDTNPGRRRRTPSASASRPRRARSGPSPRMTTSSGSRRGTAVGLHAGARAQQALVALDRHQPADREHAWAAPARGAPARGVDARLRGGHSPAGAAPARRSRPRAAASTANRACSCVADEAQSAIPARARRRAIARPNGMRSSSATSPEWA